MNCSINKCKRKLLIYPSHPNWLPRLPYLQDLSNEWASCDYSQAHQEGSGVSIRASGSKAARTTQRICAHQRQQQHFSMANVLLYSLTLCTLAILFFCKRIISVSHHTSTWRTRLMGKCWSRGFPAMQTRAKVACQLGLSFRNVRLSLLGETQEELEGPITKTKCCQQLMDGILLLYMTSLTPSEMGIQHELEAAISYSSFSCGGMVPSCWSYHVPGKTLSSCYLWPPCYQTLTLIQSCTGLS